MQIKISIFDLHGFEMYAKPLGHRFWSVPILALSLAIQPRADLNRSLASLGPNREIHLTGRFGRSIRTLGV